MREGKIWGGARTIGVEGLDANEPGRGVMSDVDTSSGLGNKVAEGGGGGRALAGCLDSLYSLTRKGGTGTRSGPRMAEMVSRS